MNMLRAPLAALVLCCGCSTTNVFPAYELHDSGSFEQAADAMAAIAANQSEWKACDSIWLLLELGKMQQDAGRFAESNAALEQARNAIEKVDDLAWISISDVGNDLQTTITDDRSQDYHGSGYERILIHTQMAINYAMLGDFESAGAHLRAQRNEQQRSLELNQRRLDEIGKRQANERSRAPSTDPAQPAFGLADVANNPDYGATMERMRGWTSRAYSDYRVPYADVVGAIVFGAAGRTDEQQQMAQVARQPEFGVKVDPPDGPLGDEVFVLFENGVAPVRVDASFGYVGPNGPTKVPVPALALRQQNRASRLRLSGGGQTVETGFVDSVDSIAATDFRDQLMMIWFRALRAVMVKEVATYVARVAARKEGKQNADLYEMGAVMAGAVWRNVVEADLRNWRSLPGEHQAARMARPPDGNLKIALLGPGGQPGATEIRALPPGPSLVFVRSAGAQSMRVHVAPLGRGR